MNYYDENAQEYSESTFNIKFSKEIFGKIENYLPQIGSDILEIGSGSGRDSRFLTDMGYNVISYEQSENMIREAQKLTGLNIFKQGSAETFKDEKTDFNFCISIACLLHLNEEQFKVAIENILKHLKVGGKFFFTVKEGTGTEIDKNGRYFKYYSEQELVKKLSSLNIEILTIFKTTDLTRPGTKWINVLLKKN